jgi:hypothetical protein
MKRWIASIVTMTTLLGIGLTIFPAVAEDEGRSPAGVLLSTKAEPGVYLVIRNVRAHFNDGMFVFVKVQ